MREQITKSYEIDRHLIMSAYVFPDVKVRFPNAKVTLGNVTFESLVTFQGEAIYSLGSVEIASPKVIDERQCGS